MNIGLDSESSHIESIGVSILTKKLESTNKIKCHFSENDKTPNTDGFFVLNDMGIPVKEFHVQIKSSNTIVKNSFSYDTKFINYVNSNVTENPSFIFAIDIGQEKIFFKYLSNQFLNDHNYLDTEQKTFKVKFDQSEILTDANEFAQFLNEITIATKVKTFNPKQINIAEYQIAFDKLNTFFDNDFRNLKNIAFPKVWKFGIVYSREKLEKGVFEKVKQFRDSIGIETSAFNSTFSIYKINYGSNQNIFQNLKLKLDFHNDNKLLPIETYISTGIGKTEGMEEDIKGWLNKTFENIINKKIDFIKFLPNDALFEIIFNFVDQEIIFNKNSNMTEVITNLGYDKNKLDVKLLYQLIINHYSENINDEKRLIKKAIIEIMRREISFVERVWEINDLCNAQIFEQNMYKLLCNMPTYYNEFISNLFPIEYLCKYRLNGEYLLFLDIKNSGGRNIHANKYFKCKKRESFSVKITSNRDKTLKLDNDGYDSWGSGMIHAIFSYKKNNILDNLLHLLYKKVCSVFCFQENTLRFESEL